MKHDKVICPECGRSVRLVSPLALIEVQVIEEHFLYDENDNRVGICGGSDRASKGPLGHLARAIYAGGGLDALKHYTEASREERAELDAAYALGGHVAVVELVKGRAP